MRWFLCAFMMLAPVSVAAQTTEVKTKTLAESLETDYQQRPDASHPGSLKAGGLAVFPGLLVHGIGHLFIDEDTSGYWLLAAGMLGVGLFATEGLMEKRFDEGTGINIARRIVVHESLVLFLGSWFADVAGTLKGSAPFAESAVPIRKATYGLSYRFVDNATHSFYHHILGDLDFDWDRVYLKADLDLDVSLDFRGIGFDMGARPIRGRNHRNYVAFGISMRREEDRRHGVATSEFLPYLEWQADLGALIRTLRNLYVTSRMGYGVTAYQFSSTATNVPAMLSDHDFWDQWLFLETGFTVNLGPWTEVGLFMAMDPSVDVVPAQSDIFGRRIADIQVVRLEFQHRHLELDWAIGGGMSLNVGLEFDL